MDTTVGESIWHCQQRKGEARWECGKSQVGIIDKLERCDADFN